MPTPLTDADKVIRNDTGKEIAEAIRELAAPEADHVSYDNTSSGLTADNAQDAIDELKTKNDTKMNKANPTGTGSLSLNRASDSTVGPYSTTEGYNCIASGQRSHAEGYGSSATANQAHAEGSETTASGNYSHSEGQQSQATAQGAHAEGRETEATANYTHAEGYKCIASGQRSHAEGTGSKSEGDYSHAEGQNTTAGGVNSHSEGYNTEASGDQSHSEGYQTKASGLASHSEGVNTIANHRSQHVFGDYNIADTSTAAATNKGNYIEIVGKGSSDANRSNARTLDWSGNETLAGGLKINGSEDVKAIKTTTVSGTTDSTGNITSDLASTNKMILSAAKQRLSGGNQDLAYVSYCYNSGQSKFIFHLTNNDGTIYANKSVIIDVFYIDI